MRQGNKLALDATRTFSELAVSKTSYNGREERSENWRSPIARRDGTANTELL